MHCAACSVRPLLPPGRAHTCDGFIKLGLQIMGIVKHTFLVGSSS